MLCKNNTRQSKIVHCCPALTWKWCDAPGPEGAGVTPRDGPSLMSPGGCCGPGERVLVPTVLSWGKSLGLLLWTQEWMSVIWILSIWICFPLNLRTTETSVNHFSAVWPVCQGTFYPKCWLHGRSPLVPFQQNSWALRELAGALQLGWSLASQQELSVVWLKPLI